MLKYIGKRLLSALLVVLGISFVIFFIMSLTPGNAATLILGENATREQIDALIHDMGLDRSIFVQYIDYMKNVLFHWDFGSSYISKIPVLEDLRGRIPATATVAIGATIIMTLIGIPVGILSAVKQYSLVDSTTMLATMVLCSMPSFFFGLLLLLIFALKLGLFPAMVTEEWRSFILPCCTCGSVYVAQVVRMTRSNMLEVIRSDYIRTARSKGAKERAVVWKHALRNAMLPIITVLGINFGAMLGGAVMTETVFSISGVGSMIIQGVRKRDTPTVMMGVLYVAVMISIVNLIVDIVNTYLDPRLRSSLK